MIKVGLHVETNSPNCTIRNYMERVKRICVFILGLKGLKDFQLIPHTVEHSYRKIQYTRESIPP